MPLASFIMASFFEFFDTSSAHFFMLHYYSQSFLKLHAYLDVDWAGDPIDYCSITYLYFLFGTSLVSWLSKKQDVVSRYSTMAKYHALVDTTTKLAWLQWLLVDLDAPQPTSTPLY